MKGYTIHDMIYSLWSPQSKKLCVQEKSGQSVSCLEWSENGEDIFCGFDLGRLVQFSVKFNEGAMNRVPLDPENYGSSLVQLSVSENLLLVSTLDRAFLLDTNTHKLDQVRLSSVDLSLL